MDESTTNSAPTMNVTGVPTGFVDLDDKISGMHPGDLIMVAARPGMGKTAFAINVAENVAVKFNLPVVIFSLEMDGAQLATRMVSSMGKLDAHRVHIGHLNGDEYSCLSFGPGKMNVAPIYIDETPALNLSGLRECAQRLLRQCGQLGLIVIDYLQLISSASAGETRATEISEIMHALKELAVALSVPVMVLSQVNRSLEQHPNKRPTISDLRESGAIEQNSDVIMFIYRDEVYNQYTPDKGIAEISIAKNPRGPAGNVRMAFLKECSRFTNIGPCGEDEKPCNPLKKN